MTKFDIMFMEVEINCLQPETVNLSLYFFYNMNQSQYTCWCHQKQ